ncbi:MAG: ferritin family protein [Thermodesulfovibrionales bacterium]
MKKFSAGEVVEMAIQTERLGKQFYTDMAGKFKDDKGLKKLFDDLAVKEERHQRIFEELKDGLGDEEPEGWTEAQPYFRAMVESEFFIGRSKSLPSMDSIRTVGDAVRFAIGFEKETLLYFVAMRSLVRDPAPVNGIIDEEMSHIIWLNRFKESLAS